MKMISFNYQQQESLNESEITNKAWIFIISSLAQQFPVGRYSVDFQP